MMYRDLSLWAIGRVYQDIFSLQLIAHGLIKVLTLSVELGSLDLEGRCLVLLLEGKARPIWILVIKEAVLHVLVKSSSVFCVKVVEALKLLRVEDIYVDFYL